MVFHLNVHVLLGIHSFFLVGVSRDCISNRFFLTRHFTSDIEADKSESGDEPGTIRLFDRGLQGLSIFPMRPFHILVTEYTKFCLESSRFTLGGIIRKLDILGLKQNRSCREIGCLSFIILNSSTNECRMYRCLILSIFSELKIGLVCSSSKFFLAVCSA